MSFIAGSEGLPPADVVVTTGRDPLPEQECRARRLAAELGATYLPRADGSLARLVVAGLRPRRQSAPPPAGQPAPKPACQVAASLDRPTAPGTPRRTGQPLVLVVERRRLSLYVDGQALYYHPGMALQRLRRLRQGRVDPMVEAMALGAGDRVLDATLGLAADALVASAVVGPEGRVVGLERVPVLAVLVREGLRSYPWPDPELAAAAARIEVYAADHRGWLCQQPPGSFDVVYFDVMFERPLSGSAAMVAWRRVAFEGALEPQTVEEARRVARRCVVLKDRRDSTRLAQLKPPRLAGGRASRVVYGVWPARG